MQSTNRYFHQFTSISATASPVLSKEGDHKENYNYSLNQGYDKLKDSISTQHHTNSIHHSDSLYIAKL
jgi:hypothetical protein